jgi:hypothetical protein
MKHLSSEQISNWLLGECDAGAKQHFDSCLKCREDVARLEQGLLEFKGAVHEWADQPIALRIPARRPSLKWAAAAATAMAVALLPMYLNVRSAQHEAQVAAELAAERANDALLMRHIESHLARSVPQPMEQLMELMNKGKDGLQ